MDITEKNFFASANSGKGFVDYFSDIFKGLEHHYIIKGGSGTGKSSLMKQIANTAISKGMSVEYYHCSSDPDSIDGIIIKDISVGLTDGTSPHTADPRYPGACDEIINVGSFWDKSKLKAKRADIMRITDKKSELFRSVYSHLSAALTIEKTMDALTLPCVDGEKMKTAINRILNKIPYTEGNTDVRMTEGITMNGYTTYSPYIDDADTIYNITDRYEISHIILNMIYQNRKGQDMTVSYSPLDTEKINMIYLPEKKIIFTVNSDVGTVNINTERFINKYVFRESRKLIRQAAKCRTEMMSGAYALLGEIKKLHFSLEDIYIKSMDFQAKEEYQKKLIDEIFS